MPRIALVTNTAAAVPPELIARYDITLVPMQINFLDGQYEEGSEIAAEEFYARLLREDVVPSTSPPSVGRYARAFQTLAADHDVVLSIHMSQALSGSYHSALAAAEQVHGAKVFLHDSGSVSFGTGLQVLTAARLIEQGAGIDPVLAALQHQRDRTLVIFAPATLRYLRNSWRAGPIAMTIASWLNIKPLIKVSDGKLELLERTRSWDAAMSRQLDEVARFGRDEPPGEIAVGHANAPAEAQAFAERVRARFPQAQIHIVDVGPVMAVHIGPGALGLATYQHDIECVLVCPSLNVLSSDAMRFFRRTLDLSLATPREATPADLTAVSRLLSQSSHRFVGFAGANLPTLLSGAPALLLTAGNEIWAAVIAGWRVDSTTWIRGLALAEGLPTGAAFDALLPPFHALLRSHALRRVYYAGDEAADIWIQPALQARGYVHETDVVVYEKNQLDAPSQGTQAVRIRRAQAVDLPVLLEVDRACFDAQWNKDESIIGPSILDAPYFMAAEIDGQIIGYAFATSHFGGRLMHLVRIAVLPRYRGQLIGVRLLADVIEFARLRGADLITLNTQAHNTAAQRLYEWFGFRRTGERQAILRFDL